MAGLFDGLPTKARTFAQGMFQIDAGATPEAAARKREMLAAMLMGGRKPQSVGEGVLDGVTRALSGWQMGRLNKAENAKRQGASDAFKAALGSTPAPTGPLSVLGMIPDQPTPTMPVTSNPQTAGAFAGAGGLPGSLIQSESGGNWNALNSEGYGGRGQFGAERLADAARAGIIPAGMTGAQYSQQPPAVQQAVEQWHRGDIMKDLGQYVGVDPDGPGPIPPLTEDSLLAVAHLGGKGGARKFVESGGRYNPSDSNGTSLAKYATMHAGGAAPVGVPAYSGPPIADLQAAVTNPWLSQEERALAQSMLSQAMQQSDPLRQLQIQQAQVDLQRSQMPEQPKPMEINGQLVDPTTGEVLGDYRTQGDLNGALPAEVQSLQWRAQQAGLIPGSSEYQDFMRNAGRNSPGVPAGFAALDAQAKAAGLEPGTEDYRQFMLGAGAGERARASTVGKAQGEAELGLSGAAQKAELAIANLEAIRNDPALPGITGMIQGRLPPMSQDGTDLNTRIQQAQGQAFLEAFSSLKGGGAITEVEGTKAEQAMARLNRAQSTEAYQGALDELTGILRQGVKRAYERAGKPMPEASTPATSGAAPDFRSMSDEELQKWLAENE